MAAIKEYITTLFNDTESKLNTWETSVVLFAMTFGSAVLTMPYMVVLAGPTSFFLTLSTLMLLFTYCSCLMAECSVYALKHLGEDAIRKDPLPCIAGLGFGEVGRKTMNVYLVVLFSVAEVGAILITATTVESFFDDLMLSYDNKIRIGILITCSIIFPFILKGSYKELGVVSFIGSITIMACLFLVMISCYKVNATDIVLKPRDQMTNLYLILFTFVGTISFTNAGAALCVPNLVANIENPEKLKLSIIVYSFLFYSASLCSGLFPYFMLGDNIQPSIINTLEGVQSARGTWQLFSIKVLAMIHFPIALVLFINPMLLLVEKLFGIKQGFSWQRSLLRSGILLLLCVLSIIFTNFSTIISLVGGGPNLIISVIVPVVIYNKLMENNIMEKLIGLLIFLLITAVIIGTMCSQTVKLINETDF